MKVFLSKLAESKFLKLTEYLLENWGLKARNEFISKFTLKAQQVSKHPNSCPQSLEVKGLFKCVVTKQTTFYYRVLKNKEEIEIITLFDSRQSPKKLKKELR